MLEHSSFKEEKKKVKDISEKKKYQPYNQSER